MEDHLRQLRSTRRRQLCVSDSPGAQLVIKGGWGVFHDLGLGLVATPFVTYPFSASKTVTAPVFPLTGSSLDPPRLGVDPPQQIWMVDRDIEMPYTNQWNLSVERSLGARQTVTVGYVGAEGHKLLKLDRCNINLLEWPAVRTPVSVELEPGILRLPRAADTVSASTASRTAVAGVIYLGPLTGHHIQ